MKWGLFMRNREELNQYINKKAKEKILSNNRKKITVFKVTCVLLLFCVSFAFKDIYNNLSDGLMEDIVNAPSNIPSNKLEEDLSFESNVECISPSETDQSYPEEFKDESSLLTSLKSSDEFLILSCLSSSVNKFNAHFNITLQTVDSIYSNSIIVKKNSGNNSLSDSLSEEIILSSEHKKLFYECIKNINLKTLVHISDGDIKDHPNESVIMPETEGESIDGWENENLQESIDIVIRLLDYDYEISIKGNLIRINNKWYSFNGEVLYDFLESVK